MAALRRHGATWAAEEFDLLGLYGEVPAAEIAEALGRTEQAVREMARLVRSGERQRPVFNQHGPYATDEGGRLQICMACWLARSVAGECGC